MIIKIPDDNDWLQLQKIHERYYGQEFSFNEFNNNFVTNYVVVDDDGRVISGGGLRTLLESVIVTDKSIDVRTRREALVKVLQASLFATARLGYDEFHCAVQNEDWKLQLLKHGFKPTKGQMLVIGV